MDLNVVAVTGRLAADPELRFTFNGTKVGSLRVAITRMKRKGEDRAGADFVDVVVWGDQAEHCTEYLAKGRRIAIRGRLQQRSWTTPSGEARSKVEIVAEHVQFLDYRDRTGEPASQESPAEPPAEPTDDQPPAEQATAGEPAAKPTGRRRKAK